ncbi:MAG: hypothetical protein PHH77_12865, partial [Victivallaceae bacterium]|nr:hypothetical protein [Victivallaceae bacterium]
MADFEMDFGYKPQSDREYRARIYGKNRLKRTIEMSTNENELVLDCKSVSETGEAVLMLMKPPAVVP